jgi:haloacetate dehalogenase
VTVNWLDGFTLDYVDVGEAVLRVRYGGTGPPVLLLHGHPRTHATWHRVAPPLACTHGVVCPDLRGYGESSKVPTTAEDAPYSKRAMAGDCLTLMRALGHDRFAVASGLALDHPAAISHPAVIDGVPIGEALARCDTRFASAWWHWFFMGNPAAEAERVINADPDAWYQSDEVRQRMGEQAWEDYSRQSTIQPRSTLCARITALALGSIASTTTPMPPPAADWVARCSWCGRHETIWSGSGGAGQPA